MAADTETVKANGNTKSDTEDLKDPVSAEISDLEKKIINQIEYYFGDCNLPKDKFLQEQIKLDDGWVPLETMLKFNRLSKLSTDSSVIISSLKKSKSGLIEIDEENKKIRRNAEQALPEMNEARREEMKKRTIYVKGFPTENTEMGTLIDFFNQHTKVDQLIMRKYLDKATNKYIFKGSVYAIFSSVEKADEFIKKGSLKYEETDLILKWEKDYLEEKKNERLTSRNQKKKKNKEDSGDIKSKEEEVQEEEEKKGLPKGAALFISNCPSELTREDVKAKIEDFGISVAFVNYQKGDSEGYVRLQEADTAAKVIENLKDNPWKEHGAEIAVKALEGEEEEAFLTKMTNEMEKRRNFKNPRGRKGKGGGNWRKRKGSPVRGESKRKH